MTDETHVHMVITVAVEKVAFVGGESGISRGSATPRAETNGDGVIVGVPRVSEQPALASLSKPKEK